MSAALFLLNKPKEWLNIYVNSITVIAQSILDSLKLTGTSNQLSFRPGDSGNSLILSASTPATTSRTVTLPDPGGNDSFTYLAASQILTNKTVYDSSFNIAAVGQPAIRVGFDVSSSLALTKTTLFFAQTANRTLTFPDQTGILTAQTSGTFNINFTCASWTVSPTASTFSWVKSGNTVTISTGPNIVDGTASGNSGAIIGSSAFPTDLWPTQDFNFQVRVRNDTFTVLPGCFNLTTSGVPTVYLTNAFTSFNDTGFIGFDAITMTYSVA